MGLAHREIDQAVCMFISVLSSHVCWTCTFPVSHITGRESRLTVARICMLQKLFDSCPLEMLQCMTQQNRQYVND